MTCDNCKLEMLEGFYLNVPVIQQSKSGNTVVLGKIVCCAKCHGNIANKFINSHRVQEAEIMNNYYEPVYIKDEDKEIAEENEDDGFASVEIEDVTDLAQPVFIPNAENTREVGNEI